MPIYDRQFVAPLEPATFLRTRHAESLSKMQTFLDEALPGDRLILDPGTHTGAAHNDLDGKSCQLSMTRSGTAVNPITIEGIPDLTILDGEGNIQRAIRLFNCQHVVIRDLIGINYTRQAFEAACDVHRRGDTTNVLFVRLIALHCGHSNDSEAIRFYGPVTNSVMRYCMAYSCGMGIGLGRERTGGDPFQTNNPPQANTPPLSGDEGYPEGLAEERWDIFTGWQDYAPSYCRAERCIGLSAGAEIGNGKEGQGNCDNMYGRYLSHCIFDECIAWYGGDDNFDVLAAVDTMFIGCYSLNAGVRVNGDSTDGNGCAVKLGVRGGLSNRIIQCVGLWARRYGLNWGDCEWPTAYRNTIAWCAKNVGANNHCAGHWCEASRSDWPDGSHPTRGLICNGNLFWGNSRGDTETAELATFHTERIVLPSFRNNYVSQSGLTGAFNIPPTLGSNYFNIVLPFTADLLTRPLPPEPSETEMVPSNIVKLWNDMQATTVQYIVRATPATVPAAVGAPI